jgi:hypothetical protein
MTQIKTRTDAELDAFEYLRFEMEYEDWCKKYTPNYIIETDEESENE